MWQTLLGGFFETLLIILVGLRLIGIRLTIKRKLIPIVVVSFYGSIILMIVRDILPSATYLIVTILAIGILMSFVIDLNIISNVISILLGCLTLILSEVISFALLSNISFVKNLITQGSTLLKALPHLTVMLLIFFILLKVNIHIPFPIKKKEKNNNYIIFSILFVLFGFLFLFYLYIIDTNELVYFSLPSAIFLIFITISVFYLIKFYILGNMENLSISLNDQYEEDISKQIRILKSQRHDFVHHLLATKQMLKRGKYEETLAYINSVLEEIAAISEVLPIQSDAISGLLLSYKEKASALGIEVFYQINDNLSYLPCKTYEINKVLGNLIVNAIEATRDLAEEKKYIHMKIYRDKYYRIQVSNFIDENNTINSAPSFFSPGFSTKSGKDRGYGLAITEELIEQYNGDIYFELTNDLITFKVNLPYGGS